MVKGIPSSLPTAIPGQNFPIGIMSTGKMIVGTVLLLALVAGAWKMGQKVLSKAETIGGQATNTIESMWDGVA